MFYSRFSSEQGGSQALKRRLGIGIAAVAVIACDRYPVDSEMTPSRVFPDIGAFKTVESVQLGMSPGEALRLRPSARPAGYVGLDEAFHGDTVRYQVFPVPMKVPSAGKGGASGSGLHLDGKIDGIDLWQHVASDSEAQALWRLRAARIARMGQHQTTCFLMERSVTARVAMFTRGRMSAGVIYYPSRTLGDALRGPVKISAIVNSFVALRVELSIPSGSPRHPVTCESLMGVR